MNIKNKRPLETAIDHENRIKSLEMVLQGILLMLTIRQTVRSAKEAASVGRDFVKELNRLGK